MGIKNLKKILSKNGYEPTRINLKSLNNKVIAIDTSIFLYKYVYFGNYIQHFTKMISVFTKYNITPLFIFDGKPTVEKAELIKKRRADYQKSKDKLRREEIEMLNNMEDISNEDMEHIMKKKKQNIKITPKIINNIKKLFDLFGIYHYQHNNETDLFCRYLFDKKYIDYAITEDVDFLTHGCKKVLTGFMNSSPNVLLYDINNIKEKIGLEQSSFIDMCILLGCDYTKTIKGIGPVSSYKYLLKYKSIENIIKKYKKLDVSTCDYLSARNMFLCEVTPVGEINSSDFAKKKTDMKILIEFLKTFNINPKLIDELSSNLVKQNKKKGFSMARFIKKK